MEPRLSVLWLLGFPWRRFSPLKSGYHQLRLHPDTVQCTTFNTPIGKFHWKVLPFGLRDAARVFGSYMTELLSPYSQSCRVYLDDIPIFSQNDETHITHVRAILEVL